MLHICYVSLHSFQRGKLLSYAEEVAALILHNVLLLLSRSHQAGIRCLFVLQSGTVPTGSFALLCCLMLYHDRIDLFLKHTLGMTFLGSNKKPRTQRIDVTSWRNVPFSLSFEMSRSFSRGSHRTCEWDRWVWEVSVVWWLFFCGPLHFYACSSPSLESPWFFEWFCFILSLERMTDNFLVIGNNHIRGNITKTACEAALCICESSVSRRLDWNSCQTHMWIRNLYW